MCFSLPLPPPPSPSPASPMVSGKGLLQCHVYDHISAGMSAIYNVKNLGILEAPPTAPVRTYYIQAEPISWDYAPLGFDGCSGNPWSEEQLTFVKTTNGTLGSQYKKSVYREYTDATFKTPKPHPPEFGLIGPIIRAEVGDKIVVHFKNKLLFDASLQMFGGLAPVGNTTQYQVRAAVCVLCLRQRRDTACCKLASITCRNGQPASATRRCVCMGMIVQLPLLAMYGTSLRRRLQSLGNTEQHWQLRWTM